MPLLGSDGLISDPKIAERPDGGNRQNGQFGQVVVGSRGRYNPPAVARAVLSAAACALILGGASARAAPPPNAIQVENARPGTTAWQVPGGGDIAVYASQITVGPGDELDLHVSTAYRYRILVFRLGWYGGTGARLVACLPGCATDEPGHAQGPPVGSQPIRAPWPVTVSVVVESDWTSGYYLIEALSTSGPKTGRAATTFVIVHEPGSVRPSDILVQVPVNTWEAYNAWGGKSLYDDYNPPRAYAVSFDRPFGYLAQSPMWWEIQLVRFLEREGDDVSYQTDVDTDIDGTTLLRHRLVIVAGHDEYWSGAMRDAFEAALAEGTNLAFIGSNDGYWQVKYDNGDRTIVSAKSLSDPEPVLANKTAMFREIGRPECQLMGVQHTVLRLVQKSLDYTVTPQGAADPWLAGTGLNAGDTIVDVVGREHDALNPYPQSCVHAGLTVLFHYDGLGVDQDADAVRYTAPSGARVFASGAQQFAWALDDWRSDGSLFTQPPVDQGRGTPVDPRLQQFMRNALDDLTRPAAPAQLVARLAGGQLVVSAAPSPDPRLVGVVAATPVGPRWLRVCRGATGCTGPLPPTAGPIVVRVVAVDRWKRRSAPAYVTVSQR
jgi:hypothetical protein